MLVGLDGGNGIEEIGFAGGGDKPPGAGGILTEVPETGHALESILRDGGSKEPVEGSVVAERMPKNEDALPPGP